MATGIPRSRSGALKATGNGAFGVGVTLHYPGKKTPAEILQMPPAAIQSVLSPKNYKGEGRLYFGENLAVLLALLDDSQVNGKVKLV